MMIDESLKIYRYLLSALILHENIVIENSK